LNWDITPVHASLKFSPDEKMLLATDERVVSLLNIVTGKVRQLIRDSESSSDRVAAFHPSGERVVTASSRRRVTEVKLWDVASADEVCTIASPQPKSTVRLVSNEFGSGRVANVANLAFTPDGNRLIGVLSEGSIVAWDAPP
jgi:WD40 repeat protein